MQVMQSTLPKIALITPYDILSDIVIDQAKNIFHCDVYNGFLDSAAHIAQKLDPSQYVAIISRGGTARYIAQNTPIPVVSIRVSSADLLRSILPHKGLLKRIAFFNFMEKLPGVREIATALDIHIDEYVFEDYDGIMHSMNICRQQQYDLIVGGSPTLDIARQNRLRASLIESGPESVSFALNEALAIYEANKRKNYLMTQIKQAISSIAEGIIVTNEKNDVILFNKKAQKIFGLQEEEVVGQQVEKIIPNTRMHEVMRSKSAEIGKIQEIGGTSIITSRVPIMANDTCIGVVCSFTDPPSIKKAGLELQKQAKKKGFAAQYTFDDIHTQSPCVKNCIELARAYAGTDSPVLIYGESGTGKELFAQSIHNTSQRRNGPFVAINCAAIPDQLLESELFGYEGGAFTGAKKEGKEGLIELAYNGTLFLDEIGELPLALQVRLLRVLQEYQIMRVGGQEVIPVNIRVVVASNKDLRELSEMGEFRKDLFYRLNILPIYIPPLRDREGDIDFLAQYFTGKTDHTVQLKQFIKDFSFYKWPGNIRELKAVVERLCLLSERFPRLSWLEILKATETGITVTSARHGDFLVPAGGKDLKSMVTEAERRIIKYYMQRYNNDQQKVMERLSISKMTLWRKLQAKE